MRKVLGTIFFILSIGNLFAEDAKGVLLKMSEVYSKTPTYKVSMRYDLLKGTEGTKVFETYKGFTMKYKKSVFQRIDNTDFVLTPDFCLKISKSEKQVELSRGENSQNVQYDFEKIAKNASKIILVEDGDYFFIDLKIKNNSTLPFHTVKIKINRKNYHIGQLDLYYTHMDNFSKKTKIKDMAQPHLRIVYSDYTSKPNIEAEIFTMKYYFTEKNNLFYLKGDYKDFELIDNRY